jgi:proteasome lid subunit RPN8/RPN11
MASVIPAVSVSRPILEGTIAELRTRGARGAEGVVLWLGTRTPQRIDVVEAYRPIYRSGPDRFVIPPEGMAELMRRIAATGRAVVAQVHSHPGAAFHSAADEQWAIVKHVGAYSVVLPNFAGAVTPDSFWRDAATFVMQRDGRWMEQTSLGFLIP